VCDKLPKGDKSIPGIRHAFDRPILIPLLLIELSLPSCLFPLLDRQLILAFEEIDLYLKHNVLLL